MLSKGSNCVCDLFLTFYCIFYFYRKLSKTVRFLFFTQVPQRLTFYHMCFICCVPNGVCSVMSESLQPHAHCSSSVHGVFQERTLGVGCHFLLQGIFLTLELNPCLLPCRHTLYHWATGETRFVCYMYLILFYLSRNHLRVMMPLHPLML